MKKFYIIDQKWKNQKNHLNKNRVFLTENYMKIEKIKNKKKNNTLKIQINLEEINTIQKFNQQKLKLNMIKIKLQQMEKFNFWINKIKN